MMTIIYSNKCEFNFKALPMESCYSIMWDENFKFFDEHFVKEVMNRVKGSMLAHVWNLENANSFLTVDSKAPYVELAREFCPRTVGSNYEFN